MLLTNKLNLETKLTELLSLPKETEWVEFKHDYVEPNKIGAYISALSNSAALLKKGEAYVVWGIDDLTREIVGTRFKPYEHKVGNQPLVMWLGAKLEPVPSFNFHEFPFQDKLVVLLEIVPITYKPVRFDKVGYIRIDSNTTTLDKFPEKERQLWLMASDRLFEQETALEKATADEVLTLLDYATYFDLCRQPLPDKSEILIRFSKDKLITQRPDGYYAVTNLGALLLAKDLTEFNRLSRKAVRVIEYKGRNRIETIKEQEGRRGYAAGFERLLSYIIDRLPTNELIGQALRQERRMYPEIAIRELVANSLIHQDLTATGTSPMIEIFEDRLEITNPGQPLIHTLRLIDEPPQSRNEMMASLMKRLSICEERGSGIDKVVFYVEMFQLPAPEFTIGKNYMKASLFAHKQLSAMSRDDKVRACYQHACLRFVTNTDMTNTSLRQRFGLDEKNYATASRIISDTIDSGLIKPKDPDNTSKKHSKYIPFWASESSKHSPHSSST